MSKKSKTHKHDHRTAYINRNPMLEPKHIRSRGSLRHAAKDMVKALRLEPDGRFEHEAQALETAAAAAVEAFDQLRKEDTVGEHREA